MALGIEVYSRGKKVTSYETIQKASSGEGIRESLIMSSIVFGRVIGGKTYGWSVDVSEKQREKKIRSYLNQKRDLPRIICIGDGRNEIIWNRDLSDAYGIIGVADWRSIIRAIVTGNPINGWYLDWSLSISQSDVNRWEVALMRSDAEAEGRRLPGKKPSKGIYETSEEM